ncbi:MAG: SDR family NAD(P)-dependent oxidoreductase, partial [Stenotrophomonas sp.]
MKQLQGKVVIITGASSGIGRAAAVLFAAEGAALVLGARRAVELDLLVTEIASSGGSAVCLPGDVCEEGYAKALVALALDQYGRLDVAFNNAGMMGPLGPTPELELADWQRTLDTNLTAMFLAAKYQVPAMQRGGAGSLIFTSTFVGHTVGFAGAAAYAASKSGIIGLTQ